MSLLTLQDIQEYKPMSNNIGFDKKVEPFIKEAQYFDLRPILGDELYLAVKNEVENPPFVNYEDLWNGSEYLCGDITYINPGLKAVLVYQSYARFLTKADTNSTAYDMVRKENKYSQGISDKKQAELVAQSMSGARGLEFEVLNFLKRNSSDYPLFRCTPEKGTTGRTRITSVRKK